ARVGGAEAEGGGRRAVRLEGAGYGGEGDRPFRFEGGGEEREAVGVAGVAGLDAAADGAGRANAAPHVKPPEAHLAVGRRWLVAERDRLADAVVAAAEREEGWSGASGR